MLWGSEAQVQQLLSPGPVEQVLHKERSPCTTWEDHVPPQRPSAVIKKYIERAGYGGAKSTERRMFAILNTVVREGLIKKRTCEQIQRRWEREPFLFLEEESFKQREYPVQRLCGRNVQGGWIKKDTKGRWGFCFFFFLMSGKQRRHRSHSLGYHCRDLGFYSEGDGSHWTVLSRGGTWWDPGSSQPVTCCSCVEKLQRARTEAG